MAAEEEEEIVQSQPIQEVLLLVLPYLPSLYELLSIRQVCRFLRDATRHETMLWANIVVDAPLNSRLSNEILTEITLKANGKLINLVLRGCLRITDDGLQLVVDANPLITKMILPGCTGLTPEGIIRSVQTLTKNNHTLETLHINGIYGFTKHHLSILQSFFPAASHRAIDVEVCPKCDHVRMVLECSRKPCKEKKDELKKDGGCRACRFCIPRCVECAACIGPNEEIQESACNDVLCLECWLLLPKCCFCNKPYCRSHINLGRETATTTTTADCSVFICEACDYDATENRYYDSES